MNAQDRFRRIDTLFRAAAALPPDARDAFLTRQCSGETSILVQVRAMLTADRRTDGLLDRPAIVPVSEAIAAEDQTVTALPAKIGSYRIIRKIGEGGMGAVFEAEQENPRRPVALKLLRGAAGSRQAQQRFQQEAQILGRLQHPGIAQILEAGTSDAESGAVPFIVMELVNGRPLTDYARDSRLDRRGRLELFARVCDAVQHAHQHGVIHRDLKPANILICDGAAAGPKILDFGVARIAKPDHRAITQQTSAGELIGTVPYMSPEQASGDPARLDWRSDVYSLGVVLFELLTGHLPHDVRRLMLHEAVRSIREDEPTLAGSIDRALRGDIETILNKALEKDTLRRYQSAAELAADIRRHLREEPIAARPASALYRVRKFARRNRGIVVGVAAAFAALLIAASVATRQAYFAERARIEETRLRHAAERQNYYARMVAAASALRRHDVAEAKRHIESAPEPLRGWEWAHLYARLDESLQDRSAGLSITCAAVSRDGSAAAACNSAGRVRVWSTRHWTDRAEYVIHGTVNERRIEQLVFSPDGKRLRADTRAGAIHFDASTMAILGRDDVAFWRRSRSGKIAIVDEKFDDSLSVREYPNGPELFRLSGGGVKDSIVRFTPDDRLLAVYRPRERGLAVLCGDTGELLFQRSDLQSVSDIDFSYDGKRLGVAFSSGDVDILDVSNGAIVATLNGHDLPVVGLAFEPLVNRVATASSDGSVRLWNATTGEEVAVMHGNPIAPVVLAFAENGARLITATATGEFRWWDATVAGDSSVLSMPATVYGLAFSPDGSHLTAAALGGEHPLRVWNSADMRETFRGLDGFLSSVAFDGEGARLAVGRSARSAPTAVISLDGTPIRSLRGHFWRTDWVGFSPEGASVISLGNNGLLSEFSLADGKPLRRRQFPGNEGVEGCRAALSPDGRLLAIAARNRIYLLLTDTWEEIGSLNDHTRSVYALGFSRDSKRLVSGGRDRSVRVWDVASRMSLGEMHGHTDEVFAATFSPDGTRIVSGGRDRVIRVWDAQHFEEITQLQGHTSFVYCLAFSPDGIMLASGGGDATVRLWHTRRDRGHPSGEARFSDADAD